MIKYIPTILQILALVLLVINFIRIQKNSRDFKKQLKEKWVRDKLNNTDTCLDLHKEMSKRQKTISPETIDTYSESVEEFEQAFVCVDWARHAQVPSCVIKHNCLPKESIFENYVHAGIFVVNKTMFIFQTAKDYQKALDVVYFYFKGNLVPKLVGKSVREILSE